MKIARTVVASLILIGSMSAVNIAMAADGVIDKVPLTTNSYCHEKFDAISGRTLGTDDPALKDATSDDVIDYYGPCNEKPAGKDQQREQRLDQEHRFENGYED